MRDASDSDTVTTPRPQPGIEQPRVTQSSPVATLPTPAETVQCPLLLSSPGSRPLPGSGQAPAPMVASGRAGQGLVCHWPETRGRAPHSPLANAPTISGPYTPGTDTLHCHVTPGHQCHECQGHVSEAQMYCDTGDSLRYTVTSPRSPRGCDGGDGC